MPLVAFPQNLSDYFTGQSYSKMENAMKTLLQFILVLAVVCTLNKTFAQSNDTTRKYILRHESEIAKIEPGSHNGGGETIGYSFFDDVEEGKLFFRKRVLHPGSAIGVHFQTRDEIFYCLSGTGIFMINGKEMDFKPGDAVLTLPGNTHSLRPAGDSDLVIFIVSEKKKIQH
jgi:mannose-6-phosphate isomerase-like protein (cupin superfamily)